MTPQTLATMRALRNAGNSLSPAELARVLGIKEETAEHRLQYLMRHGLTRKGEQPGNRFTRQYAITLAGGNRLRWAEEVWLPQQQQGV